MHFTAYRKCLAEDCPQYQVALARSVVYARQHFGLEALVADTQGGTQMVVVPEEGWPKGPQCARLVAAQAGLEPGELPASGCQDLIAPGMQQDHARSRRIADWMAEILA